MEGGTKNKLNKGKGEAHQKELILELVWVWVWVPVLKHLVVVLLLGVELLSGETTKVVGAVVRVVVEEVEAVEEWFGSQEVALRLPLLLLPFPLPPCFPFSLSLSLSLRLFPQRRTLQLQACKGQVLQRCRIICADCQRTSCTKHSTR